MQKWTLLIALCALVGLLGGCKSSDTKEINGERYAKKIYLTKEDYMEDLGNVAELDRRELPPNVESEYIFNVVPQNTEDTNIYFFDKHQQPKVPGEYTANDYKNEKRLWVKPKRYTPEQYYGMQGSDNSSEESSYGY